MDLKIPNGDPAQMTVTIPIQIVVELGSPMREAVAIPAIAGIESPAILESLFRRPRTEPDHFDDRFALASVTSSAFNWSTALSLVLASRLSYADGPTVQQTSISKWNFSDCRFITEHDTQCFVATTPSVQLVVFRGTESPGDWLADLNIAAVTRPYGIVHRGFLGQFQAVRDELESILNQNPSRPVVLAGHSLGGALATVAAAEWVGQYTISSIYTYGQPAAGRAGFVPFMQANYGRKYFRFVNNNDIVPRVPPNFSHVGQLFQLDASGNLVSNQEHVEAAMGSAESTMISPEEFDRLRSQLLAERAAKGASLAEESPFEDQLEGIFPSVSDHHLINYITKIAGHAPQTESVAAFSSKIESPRASRRPSTRTPTIVADYESVMHWIASSSSAARRNGIGKITEQVESPSDTDPVRSLDRRKLDNALAALSEASEEADPTVLHSPTNQLASLLQSEFERQQQASIQEFPFDKDDVRSVLDAVRNGTPPAKHPIQRPTSDVPLTIPNSSRIFVVGDWGTGLYGAPVTANTILSEQKKYDLLLHLGDIYYSGQPDEVQTRLLDVWPKSAGTISRTLNGNHDMYSGGFGYFDRALPAFGQKSSYFALQNDSWLLLGLDTSWLDNDLDDQQVDWVDRQVQQAGERKVILFSHHPLFSNFKDPLSNKLEHLLDDQRIYAWYWGHEHHCIVYDRHSEYQLHGRCIGHGGMPYKRDKVADAPVERVVGSAKWRKFTSEKTPTGLVLDGPNEFIVGHEKKYGPHGYAVLRLEDEHLIEEIRSPRGDLLYTGVLS